MIDNYLRGNKLITDKPISIMCEHYQLMGKQQKVILTIKKDIEIMSINRQSLLFTLDNNEYIYHNQNIEEFIYDSFTEQESIPDLDFA
jgi:predicted ATP-grasp superfamily ATP-dependent carboligase